MPTATPEVLAPGFDIAAAATEVLATVSKAMAGAVKALTTAVRVVADAEASVAAMAMLVTVGRGVCWLWLPCGGCRGG